MDLRERIVSVLTDDLRHVPWKKSANPIAGHCYVVSEALYHLEQGRYKGCSVKHEGHTHWYLTDRETGAIVDLTAGQFETPVPYDRGRGRGFLTKQPSKRTQEVIRRVNT